MSFSIAPAASLALEAFGLASSISWLYGRLTFSAAAFPAFRC